jgi:predicted acetyltransferase
MTRLVTPSRAHLALYTAALEGGWSADTTRGGAARREELARIAADADAWLAEQDDPLGRGPPVTLPDGSTRPRLPGLRRWILDDPASDGGPPVFCGLIGLRWQPGTPALPPYVLGHIGYALVPAQRGRGHAQRALAQMLPLARAQGLPWVHLTTDPDNTASQRVITANGGVLVERFVRDPAQGGTPALRYRIALA